MCIDPCETQRLPFSNSKAVMETTGCRKSLKSALGPLILKDGFLSNNSIRVGYLAAKSNQMYCSLRRSISYSFST